jgi:hypothetical protein
MIGRYYVYFLRYPDVPEAFGKRAGKVFYVGKGTGKRVASHEAATRAILKNRRLMLLKHKHKVILEIWEGGYQVIQQILGRTDSEDTAYQVESFYIDEFGLENLTNATYGLRPRKRNPRR